MTHENSAHEIQRRDFLSCLFTLPLLGAIQPVFAEDASQKPVVLESGLAYVEKNKKEGFLTSVEQKVGEVKVIMDHRVTVLALNLYLNRAIWSSWIT